MTLNVIKVWNPQTLDAVLVGPGPSNRLFIFTGIAEIDWSAPRDNILARTPLEFNLSDWHGNIHFDLHATTFAAVAWPASLHADDDADQVTWAVDAAFAFVSAASRPVLHMDLAVQGDKGMLGRVAYEVFARTTSIALKAFSVSGPPWTTHLTATVQLAQNALGNGEDVYLSSNHIGANLPAKLTVPAGSDQASTNGIIDLSRFPAGPTPVTFTAINAVSQLQAKVTVDK